ncbi:MAG TPA: hypothetical protein VG758_03015 [Hyphomicrobiaceae bacterium]|nr:hypothetical protein [Hyphomicrobiaceae bacterium]
MGQRLAARQHGRPGHAHDGDLVDLIPEWILEEGARRMILVDNPCRLYGFPQPT